MQEREEEASDEDDVLDAVTNPPPRPSTHRYV